MQPLTTMTNISQNLREIPYNYTSFSDREIVIRLLGKPTWDTLEKLRSKRKTGISARLLYDILGDMWVVKRNPYIQDDLLNNLKRRNQLLASFERKFAKIESRASNDHDTQILISAAKQSTTDFRHWFKDIDRRNKQIKQKLSKATHPDNICFDGLSRVSHVTDASDWRVEYPRAVIVPQSESEIQHIVEICTKLKLNIVSRGGGTGYTGGAVPMTEDSVVINTEKLDFIDKIKIIKLPNIHKPVHTIRAGAGTVTKRLSEISKNSGLIFAVDPTSQDSSTIGGNIATNAGGKKAVMWGTTLDNLLSWKMVMPDATWVEVTRQNHNLGKAHDLPESIFRVEQSKNGQIIKQYDISLSASEVRKPGLGKDVTNKILGRLPGVQKEGCDGIITSAQFVLHEKFAHIQTVCLEFFNPDMHQSVSAIVGLIALIKRQSNVHLTGLEHLDERYIKAVGYSSKSTQNRSPNMLLIADISGEKIDDLQLVIDELVGNVSQYQAEAFVATTAKSRADFWADRSKTAAIAAHTNAFKINEDVVIPLEKLADYSAQIETINVELSMQNKIEIIEQYQLTLQTELDKLDHSAELDKIDIDKINSLLSFLQQIKSQWQETLQAFGTSKSMLKQILTKKMVISLKRTVQTQIDKVLSGSKWQRINNKLKNNHQTLRNRRIFIATHMHAGDGNVHTNIPVHSNDYEMLHQAELVVDKIMAIAQSLGGVISGEHGIGLTKIKYVKPENISDFLSYKKAVDPNNLFNRGKLSDQKSLQNAYTPSLRLLEMEALILEQSMLGELNQMTKDCLRCGKCKPVCATHVPRSNLLYSPRNKILATGMLIEAFLYEEQTKRGISYKHFDSLNDIADHCTICHRCFNPCPVDIDFGDVTVVMRRFLRNQKKRRFSLGSKMGMLFLNLQDPRSIRWIRWLIIRTGYIAQRCAGRLIRQKKTLPNTIGKVNPKAQLVQFVKHPMPNNIPAKTMRAMLSIEDKNTIPVIQKNALTQKMDAPEAVFYFPGCGSERLFSQIGLGVLKWLYELGFQTVFPPGYLCCGYPQMADGQSDNALKMSTSNRVLFHRIAKNTGHLRITKIVVSCGTCLDQLLTYELKSIFPEAKLVDIHELLDEKNVVVPSNEEYLFHEPCHSPTKSEHGSKISAQLLQTKTIETEDCCGESGTFATARADIAAGVKAQKIESIVEKKTEKTTDTTILTTCPSCLQGLSRLHKETKVKADYPLLVMAKAKFGEHWAKNFINEIPEADIDRILL